MNEGKLYRESMELFHLACDMSDDALKVMEANMVTKSQSVAVVTMLAILLYKSVIGAMNLKEKDKQQYIDSILEELKFNLNTNKQ